MHPLISVIVPVYNVEEYLDRCINSIVQQTYKNLEIILVNDGSTDNSSIICNEWREKDFRIKVIHKENGGISSARNCGLKEATGDYIGFVDSDDYIDLDMYNNLIYSALAEDADLVMCDFIQVVDNQDCNIENRFRGVIEYSRNNLIKEFLLTNIQPFTWNKLYKKNLFDNISFPINKIYEDEFVFYRILHKSKKFIGINYVGYYYCWRSTSIMNENFSNRQFDLIEAVEEVITYIKNYYPQYYKLSYYKYLYVNMLLYNKIRKSKKYCEEKKILRRNMYRNILKIPVQQLNFEQKKLYITAILAILRLR